MRKKSDADEFPPVCMLFQGAHAHPSHRAFADSVNAEYRHFETGKPPIDDINQDVHNETKRIRTALSIPNDYSIVIAEGTAPVQTAMAYKLVGNWETTVIYLAADETFYTLNSKKSKLIWKALTPITKWALDGIIAVGRDVYDWATPYLGKIDMEVVHPPIDDEKYDRLSSLPVTSSDEEFIVLSAGTTKNTNNYDMLSRATGQLVDAGIPVRTVILGSNHPDESYADLEHVTTPGFVEMSEFTSWFKRASVYVQPSVGDSFPVAVLEGILSGTPTLVTSGVGVRELLPKSQEVAPTADALAEGIRTMYETPAEERHELASSQRNLVADLTVDNQTKDFQRAVRRFYS